MVYSVTCAEFLTPLRTEKIGPQRWLLIDDLIFKTVAINGILVAPRGFQTDLASIPRFLWGVFPKVDRYDAAAVMHDAGYGNALMTEHGERVYLIKPLCDKMFHEGCLVLGVGPRRAAVMNWAVSTFGDHDGHPLAAHAKDAQWYGQTITRAYTS